jgi:hypothetical protein
MTELERMACAVNSKHSRGAVEACAGVLADELSGGHRQVRADLYEFLVLCRSLHPALGECGDCGRLAVLSDDEQGCSFCVSCALADSTRDFGTASRPGHPSGQFEVLGRDAEMTCLAHRLLVRWLPAPAWWVHNPPGDGTAECAGMRSVPAPVVVVRKDGPA